MAMGDRQVPRQPAGTSTGGEFKAFKSDASSSAVKAGLADERPRPAPFGFGMYDTDMIRLAGDDQRAPYALDMVGTSDPLGIIGGKCPKCGVAGQWSGGVRSDRFDCGACGYTTAAILSNGKWSSAHLERRSLADAMNAELDSAREMGAVRGEFDNDGRFVVQHDGVYFEYTLERRSHTPDTYQAIIAAGYRYNTGDQTYYRRVDATTAITTEHASKAAELNAVRQNPAWDEADNGPVRIIDFRAARDGVRARLSDGTESVVSDVFARALQERHS